MYGEKLIYEKASYEEKLKSLMLSIERMAHELGLSLYLRYAPKNQMLYIEVNDTGGYHYITGENFKEDFIDILQVVGGALITRGQDERPE